MISGGEHTIRALRIGRGKSPPPRGDKREPDSVPIFALACGQPVSLKEPRVRGIQIGNRTAVFYSREDLSAGLVGEPVDGIIGYTPETATEIMRNILLYAVPAPEPNPSTPAN